MSTKDDFKFHVIGNGLPRTGTFSLMTALEMLFPGDCMHMYKVMDKPDQVLQHVLPDNSTDEDFKNYFISNNVTCGVDAPFNLIYKRALKEFPEAKVVLTVRDDPEKWVKSMLDTVCQAHGKNSHYKKFPNFLYYWYYPKRKQANAYMDNWPKFMEIVDSVENGKGVEFYNNWLEDVKSTVPADQLLIFNVKQGWKPLCEFLNVPIPKGPFPRANDSNEFINSRRRVARISWATLLTLFGLTVFTGVATTYLVNKYIE